MDACRELMMRLVWGKSQGQLRDSWNPSGASRFEPRVEIERRPPSGGVPVDASARWRDNSLVDFHAGARAQKEVESRTGGRLAGGLADAASVKESAAYWNKSKIAEGDRRGARAAVSDQRNAPTSRREPWRCGCGRATR